MPLIPAQQGGATYSQLGFLAQSSFSHVELLLSQLSSPAPVCPSPPPVTPGAHTEVCVFLGCQEPCAVLFGDWLFPLQQALCQQIPFHVSLLASFLLQPGVCF